MLVMYIAGRHRNLLIGLALLSSDISVVMMMVIMVMVINVVMIIMMGGCGDDDGKYS